MLSLTITLHTFQAIYNLFLLHIFSETNNQIFYFDFKHFSNLKGVLKMFIATGLFLGFQNFNI